MAAAAVENDIDDFIRNQKAKLQQERQYLNVSKLNWMIRILTKWTWDTISIDW